MFGIIAINRGMWGISAWVQHDGKPELYPTREAAEAAADRYNHQQGPVNRFTDYFAEEYKSPTTRRIYKIKGGFTTMKRIFYSAITGPDDARQMGEIMEAPHGEEWDGDTAAYLENLDPAPAYREGPQHIPGDIMQHFTATPVNICVTFDGDEPREIYWSDTAE